MGKTYYVCKYTPLELLAAFGGECENLNHMPEGFDFADQIAHPNLCGFGKSVLEAVLAGEVRELVLVNCCDTIRSVYDLLKDMFPGAVRGQADEVPERKNHAGGGQLEFLYRVDALHCGNACSRERMAAQLADLAKKYGEYKGKSFDYEAFRSAFSPQQRMTMPHIAVLGARMGEELFEMTAQNMPLPVVNETCVHNRSVAWTYPEEEFQAGSDGVRPDGHSDTGANAGESNRSGSGIRNSDVSNVQRDGCACGNGAHGEGEGTAKADFSALMDWYAGELLGQIPCMRMLDATGRKQLYQDPSLKGIIYHTVKFCDFYSFEYADIKSHTDVPLLKIESDYTVQSSGQLLTRLEAFAESLSLNPQRRSNAQHSPIDRRDLPPVLPASGRRLAPTEAVAETFSEGAFPQIVGEIRAAQENPGAVPGGGYGSNGCSGCAGQSDGANCAGQSGGADWANKTGMAGMSGEFAASGGGMTVSNGLSAGQYGRRTPHMGKGYFAGIDSGSTSTDVVILNKKKEIVASIILPTGAGAAIGAERALEQALQEAKLEREDIDSVVTTGYGRTAIQVGDKSITEITCHARGAHFLDPRVRTVVDIGGQDSKVIRLDEDGSVKNFVMNDKCAAGTGRFLEMMARTMEMSLDEIGKAGLSYEEDITISSMCTVFAESEVVSLIAQNKKPDDIVHGLNKAVAAKTAALVKRVGGAEAYMMTGGVAQNQGLVKTLEERLGTKLIISDKAQLCGALGAALYAADMG
ncbi:MAG: acyl-CoA dehydratase activase [Lachnospiraceae bacterium]|nr:acyl-CoA dehydratase activase [Lachnospiraceae bacterium]